MMQIQLEKDADYYVTPYGHFAFIIKSMNICPQLKLSQKLIFVHGFMHEKITSFYTYPA